LTITGDIVGFERLRNTVSQVRQAAGDIAGQAANEVVGGDRVE
jgi:hypothetical protein